MNLDPCLLLLRARAVCLLANVEKAAKKGGKFDSVKHPRYPAGNPKGGQFRPKLGTGSGGAEIFMPVYTGSNKIIQSFEAATLAVANQMAQGVMTGAQKLLGIKTHPDDTNNTKLKSTVRQLAAGVAKPDVVPGVTSSTAVINSVTPKAATVTGVTAHDVGAYADGQFKNGTSSIKTDELDAIAKEAGGLNPAAVLGFDPLQINDAGESGATANKMIDAAKKGQINDLLMTPIYGSPVSAQLDGLKAKLMAAVGLEKEYGEFQTDWKAKHGDLPIATKENYQLEIPLTVDELKVGSAFMVAGMQGKIKALLEKPTDGNPLKESAKAKVLAALFPESGVQNLSFSKTPYGLPKNHTWKQKEVDEYTTKLTAVEAAANKGDMATLNAMNTDWIPADYTNAKKHFLGQIDAAKAYVQSKFGDAKPAAITAANVSAKLSDIFPNHNQYQETVANPSSMIGRYGVVGKLDSDTLNDIVAASHAIEDVSFSNKKLDIENLYQKSWESVGQLDITKEFALREYTGASFVKVNENMMSGNPSAKNKDAIAGAETAVIQLQPGTILGRGHDVDSPATIQKLLNSKGTVLQDIAISSTDYGSGWNGKDVKIRYKTLPGAKGLYIGVIPGKKSESLSYVGAESEILLSPKSRILVTRVEDKNYDPNYWSDDSAKVYMDVLLLPENDAGSTLDTLNGGSVATNIKPTAGNVKPVVTPVATPKPAPTPAAAPTTGALSDPPKIASASNPAYQKKIDGLYASVKAGDMAALDAFIPLQQAKVDAAKLKPTQNAHDKWNAQLLTAALELKAKAVGAKVDATATAATTPAVKPALPVKPVADANSAKAYFVDKIDGLGQQGLSGSATDKLIATQSLKSYLKSGNAEVTAYAQAWLDHLDANGTPAATPPTMKPVLAINPVSIKPEPAPAAKPTPAPVVTATATAAVISAPKGIGSKTHAQYTKQGDAVYQAALTGDKAAVDAFVAQYQAKNDAAKLKPNYPTFADGQYNKLLAYSQKVQAEMQTAATAGLPATAPKSALTKTKLALADMTLMGSKPGGSNPGGVYQDADGAQWLVKGSNKPDPDGGPAKNEVLAARLYNAAGGHAPEMRTVDLGTQYGGGIGVASKMQDLFSPLDVNNPAHIAKVREDFAMDAWLANWDSVGMGFDNTVIDMNGNALRIDPGGALLYRAQGEPKGADFGKAVNEWNTLRDSSKNPQAAQVFAGMTDSELKASAAKVAAISDSTIQALVSRFGPGDAAAKTALAETLIARKQDVIAKAGLLGAAAAVVNPEPDFLSMFATLPPTKPDISGLTSAQQGLFTVIDGVTNKTGAYSSLSDAEKTQVLTLIANGTTGDITSSPQSKAYAQAWLDHLNAGGTATAPTAAVTASVKPAATPAIPKKPVMPASIKPGMAAQIQSDLDLVITGKKPTQYFIDEYGGLFAKTSPDKKAFYDQTIAYLDALDAAKNVNIPTAATPTIKPALPNFNSYKLEASNTNAPGVNAKVDKIAALAQAGDVAGILAMSYGSNTYAKKTVNLANDVLAALGSTETVTVGQKAGTHPGIGGTTKPATATVKPAATPATKTPVQTLAADFKVMAETLKDVDADGGIGTVKQVLDHYSATDPDYVKTYLGVVATSNDYSPGVKAFAQKVLAMPDGVNALTAAWIAPDPNTPATHTGAWANQYGAGVGNLTTRVTALGAATAAKPHFDPAKLTQPPDYNNLNGPGQGLSSQPAKNAVSNQIAQELYVLAANGDLVALKNYDFSAKVGGAKNTKTEEVVGMYRDQLIGQIDNMLNPPPPIATWKIGGTVTPDNVSQTLQQAFPQYKQYQQVFQNKAHMVGRWGIHGGLDQKSFQKVTAAADAIPAKQLDWASPELQTIYEQSYAQFNTLTAAEKKAIKDYTGGIYTTWNNQIANNQLSADVKVGMSAYEKASVELPPGLILSRKWDLPEGLANALIAPDLMNLTGKVVQDVAMISSSIDPDVWSGSVRMRIKTLPGARGFYVSKTANSSKYIGNHPGEKEIVLNSKTRFLVTKVSKTNYDKSFFEPGGKIFMDVLALPEDPAGSVLDSMGGVK